MLALAGKILTCIGLNGNKSTAEISKELPPKKPKTIYETMERQNFLGKYFKFIGLDPVYQPIYSVDTDGIRYLKRHLKEQKTKKPKRSLS
jgi:hypothetical protein